MTERQGDVHPKTSGADARLDLITHKAARECGITQPHHPDVCGIVQARRQAQAAADAAARTAASQSP